MPDKDAMCWYRSPHARWYAAGPWLLMAASSGGPLTAGAITSPGTRDARRDPQGRAAAPYQRVLVLRNRRAELGQSSPASAGAGTSASGADASECRTVVPRSAPTTRKITATASLIEGAKGGRFRRCMVLVSGTANGIFVSDDIGHAAARRGIEVRVITGD